MNFSFEHFTESALTWLGIFLSVFLVYFGYRYQASKAPLEKQLYRVYLPMFRILEPKMYESAFIIGKSELQKISDQIGEIIDKHYELVHPSIVHWNRMLKNELDTSEFVTEKINDTFIYLCYLIDKEFEKTRKRMFLPTRGIIYRLNNKQYVSRERMYFDVLRLSIYHLALFILVIASVLWITAVIALLIK